MAKKVINDAACTAVPDNFINEYMPSANAEFVKVYLYALSNAGEEMTNGDIAEKLGILESDVCKAWDFWRDAGIVELSDENIKFLHVPHRVEKKTGRTSGGARASIREVSDVLKVDKNLSDLCQYMQNFLGRVLSTNEIKILYSIYTDIGFPVDLIMFLIQYCGRKGQTNLTYIERTALGWKEKGIMDEEAAEGYVQMLEEREKQDSKLKKVLNIPVDRPFSKSEKEYVDRWRNELGFGEKVIALAYDQTMVNTGKLTWAYLNTILVNWHKKGLLTEAAVRGEIEGRTKKNKFNNFTQKSLDMNDIEMAVIQKRLKEQGAIK